MPIITEPGQANAYGTLHGGVLLRLADECGAVCALRHAGRGQITTAAIDSMMFLGPVYVGERVEFFAEVTYVGRTSIETRIDIFAEPAVIRAGMSRLATAFMWLDEWVGFQGGSLRS